MFIIKNPKNAEKYKEKITNPITQEKASTVSEHPVGHLFKHVCRWEDGWMNERKKGKEK